MDIYPDSAGRRLDLRFWERVAVRMITGPMGGLEQRGVAVRGAMVASADLAMMMRDELTWRTVRVPVAARYTELPDLRPSRNRSKRLRKKLHRLGAVTVYELALPFEPNGAPHNPWLADVPFWASGAVDG